MVWVDNGEADSLTQPQQPVNAESPRAFNTSQGYFEPTPSGAPPMTSTQSTYNSGVLQYNAPPPIADYTPSYTPTGYSADSPYNPNFDPGIGYGGQRGGGLVDVNETTINALPQDASWDQVFGPSNDQLGVPYGGLSDNGQAFEGRAIRTMDQGEQFLKPTNPMEYMDYARTGRLAGVEDHGTWGGILNALEPLVSGNRFVSDVTKGNVNLGGLPRPVSMLTDVALAPATLLSAGLGGEAPIIGSAFKGPFLGRLAGETAVGLGGMAASEGANQVLPEDMNPYLRTGLTAGAGILGGLGTLGAIKAGERVVPSVARGVSDAASNPALRTALADETGGGVLPTPSDRFRVRNAGPQEAGTRPGELLKPKAAEQLPENYTPKDVLSVAQDVGRQVNSQANTLRSEAELALKDLGPRVTGVDGNVYFRNIAASPAEASIGESRALAVRVLERPNEYALTAEQAAAVAKLAGISEAVKNERTIFGVAPREVALEEGQNYMHRLATGAVERPGQAQAIENLVNGGKLPKGMLDLNGGGGTGGASRLAIGTDKTRLIADPIDFVKRGGTYADPLVALDQNVASGLSKAANAHVKSLLEPFAQTAADRVSPEFRAKVEALRNRAASLEKRVTTAEAKVKTTNAAAKELQRPLDKLKTGVLDKPTARTVLKDARTELRQAQRDAMQESRRAGGAVAKDQAARSAFERAQSRANAALTKLQEAQKDALGLGEVTVPGMGVRLPPVKGAAVERAVQEASLATDELRALARKTAMPVRAEAASNATMLERGSAEIAARGAKGTVDEATARVVGAAKDLAPDDVYSTITQLERRIQTLRDRGTISFQQADSLGKQAAAARSAYDDILPSWRKAIDASHNIPAGRAAVDSRLAPALIGRDFEQGVAKQIERFYGRTATSDVTQVGRVSVGARALNTALIPAKATLDFSALLNQQGRMLVMHPVAYAKNFAKSLRDIVNPTEYNRLMSSQGAKDAASRGLVLLGEAGQRNEFQFNNWFEHIPGIGKIARGTNRQFTAFNNRMRLQAFGDWTDAAARAGKPLDAAGEESLAKALNRMTGISNSRAGDLEQLAFFAPNYLRSHFENIGMALSNGGIEGAVARRYLGTTFAVGTSLVAGVAMAQGRDPSEVLSPFDVKALKSGELRWNSNFGTIRVGGQDIQVYGPYTSLARLAAVATTGALDSLREKDARPFLASLMQFPETKGSPVTRYAMDLAQGKTFEGNSPTELSVNGLTNTLIDLAPISVANAIRDKQQGLSWHDTILDSITNAIGANSNPVTPYEKRDQQAMDKYGKPWNELSYTEQNALKAQQGSPAATYQSTNPAAIQSKQVTDQLRQQNITTQQQIDQKYAGPDGVTPVSGDAGKAWRDEYHTAQWGINQQYKTKDLALPFTGNPSDEPMHKAVEEWSATIDKNTVGTQVNWDAVDQWMAENPDKAALVNQYMADPNKPNSALTPMVSAYRKASDAIGSSGFFDLRDNLWKELNSDGDPAPGYKPGQGYFDWKNAQVDEIRKEMIADGIDPAVAPSKAAAWVDSHNVAVKKFENTFYKDQALYPWIDAHPDLAKQAVEWGYLTPDKKVKQFLQTGSWR